MHFFQWIKKFMLRIEPETRLSNKIYKEIEKGRLKTETLRELCSKFQYHMERNIGEINDEKDTEKNACSFFYPYFEDMGELNRQQKSGNGYIDLMLTIYKKQGLFTEIEFRKILFELKIGYSPSYLKKGLKRIKQYMDTERLNFSFYLVFHDTKKFSIGQVQKEIIGNKEVYVYYIKVKIKPKKSKRKLRLFI